MLTVLPDDGLEPTLTAIEKAKKSIEIVIFRLDVKDIVTCLGGAVKRGVTVRALIAHTNKGGEKALRKLETRLLDAGVTVSRSADELVRYHGKMMVVDGRRLHVNGFNFTWLDMGSSRSFGVVTTNPRLVREGLKLFQADSDRQPYAPASAQFLVSPENARERLAAFIKGAKKQLLIYDMNVNDPRMLRLLAERVNAGVDVRIIGKGAGRCPVKPQRHPGKRLHVRAIIRDGNQAFVGSQSLRALELDRRREIGLIVSERRVVARLIEVFESDWHQTAAAAEEASQKPKGAAVEAAAPS